MPLVGYPLQRLRDDVRRHICRQYILNGDFVGLDSYSGEMAPNVDMLRALVLFWIFGEGNRFLVVSEQQCGSEFAIFL